MKRTRYLTSNDVSHALLVLFFLASALWYLMDTVGASERLENIIFVGPLAGIAIGLSLYILVRLAFEIRARAAREKPSAYDPAASDDRASEDPTPGFVTRWRAPIVAFLFALYVATLNVIGFDLSTFLFTAGCLIVQGERNPLVYVGYPLLFAALVTYAFRLLVPYPFATLLF